MGSTAAKYHDGNIRYYDRATYENRLVISDCSFYDDFLGANTAIPAAASSESGMPWVKKIVGAAPPTVAKMADAAGGWAQCALTSANQKQNADLLMDDQREWDLTKGFNFEARVKLSVLPTDVAEIVWGVFGDWADGPDAVTYSCFFTADGSGEVFCEMDDNATDRSATSGVTATALQTKIYRIDASDVSSVKFYIDGVQVATGTTFAYAATGANAILQPVFSCYKATGAGVGTIEVDYVRLWQARA